MAKTSRRKSAAGKKGALRARPVPKRYTSSSIPIAGLAFYRADLEFEGVDHSGASFEGRIFLNNTGATQSTPTSLEHGYAGSFHIFGHGGCFGDVGHCEITSRRPYDPRPGHPLTPARKVVIATEAVRRLTNAKAESMTVTIVPVVTALTEQCDPINVLKFNQVRLVTYL
jgi:tyrosinase